MTLIVNGTTIPSSATVKVGSTSLTKIVCNGVTVWSKEIYVIKDGVLQSGYSMSTSSGGYSNGTGTGSSNSGTKYYGGWGHTNGTTATWGVDTNNIATNGCSSLYVKLLDGSWSGSVPWAWANIYGISASGAQTTIQAITYVRNEPGFSNDMVEKTYNVSAYSSVRVEIKATSNSSSNAWMNVGIVTMRLY